MSNYDAIKLRMQDGTIVAYFAPNFKTVPVEKNDLIVNALPRFTGQKIRDINKWSFEIRLQGAFDHSDNLPDDHSTALETVFGSLPVTARDQINRIRYFARSEAPMELIDNTDEYTATNTSEVDFQAGTFPTVFLSDIRPKRTGGQSRMSYTFKFEVGFEL